MLDLDHEKSGEIIAGPLIVEVVRCLLLDEIVPEVHAHQRSLSAQTAERPPTAIIMHEAAALYTHRHQIAARIQAPHLVTVAPARTHGSRGGSAHGRA